MKITVTIEADERESAAKHLMLAAQIVGMGMTDVSGHNEVDNTAWSIEVEDDEWPHGDYNDEKGNLLHVHNNHVVHVTRANANADTENIKVHVDEWIEEYGVLTYIPQAEAPADADS